AGVCVKQSYAGARRLCEYRHLFYFTPIILIVVIDTEPGGTPVAAWACVIGTWIRAEPPIPSCLTMSWKSGGRSTVRLVLVSLAARISPFIQVLFGDEY